jgi:transcriptional regulator with XRE-family HTH domain
VSLNVSLCNVDAIDDKILQELKKSIALQLGQQIKMIRKRKRLSQSDLAFLVDMDRQYIYKIETAKVTPNIGTITAIAFAMGISLSTLFEDFTFELIQEN